MYENLYIEIERLTLNDAGRYTCVAESPAGRAETHFDIDVTGIDITGTSARRSSSTLKINHVDSRAFSSTGLQRFSITRRSSSTDQYHSDTQLRSLRLSESLH